MSEESYLNDLERESLVKFNQDVIMREAVRKVILYFIYSSGLVKAGKPIASDKHWVYGLTVDKSFSDEKVGQMLRTKIDASSMLEEGFKKLEEFKAEMPKQAGKVNPAR